MIWDLDNMPRKAETLDLHHSVAKQSAAPFWSYRHVLVSVGGGVVPDT